MYTTAFYDLKKAYEAERSQTFNDEQFAALLYTMPAVLIAGADGNVDETELSFIRDIPHSLIAPYRNREFEQEVGSGFSEAYHEEVRHLVNHVLRWQDSFLDTLKGELNTRLNDKNAVYDMMWKTASSSRNVSDGEIRRLKKLTKALGF